MARVVECNGVRRPEEWSVTTDDGVRLHGARWPARRDGAPLVLALHGITGNRLGFLPLADALDGEVELIAYDARGRGRSDKPADPQRYGHRRHAEDAATVLRELTDSQVIVVGQSMGAWGGLQLAAHHPDLVAGLVLGDGGYFLDLPPGSDPADEVAAVMGPSWLDRLQVVFPSRADALGAFRSVPPYTTMWNDDIEALLHEALEDRPDGTVGLRCSPAGAEYDSVDYFRPFGAVPYVRTDLARVSCPVHLVRAERGFDISPETVSPLIPEPAVESFRRELPQLTVETVPGTTHYTVNFGADGVAVIADAVRKALP